MTHNEESVVLSKSACPKCQSIGADTSQDNLVNYSDGHSYCFACCSYYAGTPQDKKAFNKTTFVEPNELTKDRPGDFLKGTYRDLVHRGIREDTCRLFDYQTAMGVEIENFIVGSVVVSQHVRNTENKDFSWVSHARALPLWGQWLFPQGGKRLLITEGAIDCMTMSQLFMNKYPVVSIPNGTGSAARSIKDNYEFVASFDTVVLCFDMDSPGQAAARAVADILPPGKVRIMKLPRKDPNEMLLAGESAQLLTAYWNASLYSPDSILHVSSVINSPKTDNKVFEFPWDGLTSFMVGQDAGRLNLWAAAPGQGKTSFIREVVAQHLKEGRAVGCIFLEESPEQTVDDLISLVLAKPVRRIRAQRQLNVLRESFGKDPILSEIEDSLSEEEYAVAADIVSKLPLYLYDHIGNADLSNILSRLDFMAVGLGCQVLVIDHITLLGNMLLDSKDSSNNERLVLDNVMKHLRALVERTGCIIHVISHIKKSDKNVDEGAKLALGDLRGSGSLAQIADNVFSLERNRQATNLQVQNTTMIRLLKNRKTGKCGPACALYYDTKTATLKEVKFTINEEGEMVYLYEASF